jgi:CsoR family transcriptional regulator, copper-sensing transcriptional repressor
VLRLEQPYGAGVGGDLLDDIATRLRRIEGQVGGIRRMIDAGRSPEEVLDQLASIRAALEAVACLTLERRLEVELSAAPALDAEAARDVMAVVRRFTKAV